MPIELEDLSQQLPHEVLISAAKHMAEDMVGFILIATKPNRTSAHVIACGALPDNEDLASIVEQVMDMREEDEEAYVA